MNKALILLYILTLIAGCKHDEEMKKSPLQQVFVGKVSSDMIYYDFIPDVDLDTLSIAIEPEINKNRLRMDLNSDNIDDVEFQVYYSTTQNGGINFLPLNTQNNRVGYSCSWADCGIVSGGVVKRCSGIITPISFGTKVSNDACKWSITDSIDNENYSLYNASYFYKGFYSTDTIPWQPEVNQYIGFRFIENTDTLYGWMRLSIMGKAHVVIHDLAYQKRFK